MKRTLVFNAAMLLLLMPLVFGCQSSYKVTKDSYVFSTVKHTAAEKASSEAAAEPVSEALTPEITAAAEGGEKAIVSSDNAITSESVNEKISQTSKKPEFIKEVLAEGTNREEAKKAYKNLSRSEKKEVKKWLKSEVKEYKKQVRELKKTHGSKAVTRDMRTGIILGAVGLVLLLIGGGTILYIIGAILFVVGLVFILLEVL